MPGTSDGIIDEESFGKRATVMCANGADRKEFVPAPRKDHRRAVRVSEQHGAIVDFGKGHSALKIGPVEWCSFFAHFDPP